MKTGRANRDSKLRLLASLVLAVTVAVTASALVFAGSVKAEKRVSWANYDVTLDLLQDGSYHVTERQEIDFSGGTFSGAFATLPLARTTGIDNVKVAELAANGKTVPYRFVPTSQYREAPATFTTKGTSSSIEVDWGFEPTSYVDSRTFILSYDVHGALRVYGTGADKTQQIWWTAIPTDVTDIAPVQSASVRINLPEAVDPAKALLGENADEDWHQHTSDGQHWAWQKTGLASGDEFTVRLEFPAIVDAAAPSWQARDDQQRLDAEKAADRTSMYNVIFLAIGLLFAAAGGIGIYGLWYLRGRDPHVGLVAEFLPAPPDDLPPGIVGALVDEVANERDIVATLVDLGRRGVLSIDQQGTSSALGGSDYQITLKETNPTPISPFEDTLLHALFGSSLDEGETSLMSRARGQLAGRADKIKDQMYDELVRRGYFLTSPKTTRARWKSGPRAIAIIGIVLLFVLGSQIAKISGFLIFPVIVVIALAFILSWIGEFLPKKTEKGAEAAAKWNAFKRYLSDIDRYDKVAESSEIFEKYLPYAVAFGLERSWVQRFSAAGAQQPAWFGPVIVTDPHGGMGYPRQRGAWGGWNMPTAGGSPGGGSGKSGGGFDFPSLQGMSDETGRSVQGASNSFFDMLNSAGRAFMDFSSSGGGGGGRRNWGGGGGGFHGGGSHGGSSGGGGRGFH